MSPVAFSNATWVSITPAPVQRATGFVDGPLGACLMSVDTVLRMTVDCGESAAAVDASPSPPRAARIPRVTWRFLVNIISSNPNSVVASRGARASQSLLAVSLVVTAAELRACLIALCRLDERRQIRHVVDRDERH